MTKPTATNEQDILEECQAAIGYRFNQVDLLRSGLTHTSGAETRISSNERMEFLGDAILGLIVVEQIYLQFPEYQEGELTKIKSAVVSRRTCARLSRKLGLDKFMFLGKGMHLHAAMPSNILADVFESLVGAVYLDGGLEAVKQFCLKLLEEEINAVAEGEHGNYKSVLQQLAQKDFNETPFYHLLDEKGPDHSKCFKVAAGLGRYRYPAAWGKTKKEAEQKAAMNALAKINDEPIPFPSD